MMPTHIHRLSLVFPRLYGLCLHRLYLSLVPTSVFCILVFIGAITQTTRSKPRLLACSRGCKCVISLCRIVYQEPGVVSLSLQFSRYNTRLSLVPGAAAAAATSAIVLPGVTKNEVTVTPETYIFFVYNC